MKLCLASSRVPFLSRWWGPCSWHRETGLEGKTGRKVASPWLPSVAVSPPRRLRSSVSTGYSHVFFTSASSSNHHFFSLLRNSNRNWFSQCFSIPRSMPSENWLCSLLQSDLNFEHFYLTQVLRSLGFTDQQWNKRTISPVFHTQINVIGAFWINVFGWQIAKCLPFFSESHARIRPRDSSAAHSVDDRLLRETLFSCLLKRWLIFVAHLCLWFLLLYSLMPQFNLLIIY